MRVTQLNAHFGLPAEACLDEAFMSMDAFKEGRPMTEEEQDEAVALAKERAEAEAASIARANAEAEARKEEEKARKAAEAEARKAAQESAERAKQQASAAEKEKRAAERAEKRGAAREAQEAEREARAGRGRGGGAEVGGRSRGRKRPVHEAFGAEAVRAGDDEPSGSIGDSGRGSMPEEQAVRPEKSVGASEEHTSAPVTEKELTPMEELEQALESGDDDQSLSVSLQKLVTKHETEKMAANDMAKNVLKLYPGELPVPGKPLTWKALQELDVQLLSGLRCALNAAIPKKTTVTSMARMILLRLEEYHSTYNRPEFHETDVCGACERRMPWREPGKKAAHCCDTCHKPLHGAGFPDCSVLVPNEDTGIFYCNAICQHGQVGQGGHASTSNETPAEAVEAVSPKGKRKPTGTRKQRRCGHATQCDSTLFSAFTYLCAHVCHSARVPIMSLHCR